jgi:hypothetical protein
MPLHFEIDSFACAKGGEELCGDTIRVDRSPERILILLSDGLGSGVQANVSSTLTVEILSRMLGAGIPLHEVVPAIAATLPVRQSMNAAYATFSIIDIDRRSNFVRLTNYGNPPFLFFRRQSSFAHPAKTIMIDGREIQQYEFFLQPGDYIVCMSDGVPGASTDMYYDSGWSMGSICKHIENVLHLKNDNAPLIVKDLANQTLRAYGTVPRDDASIVVLRAREGKRVSLFTGPPADPASDDACAERFLKCEGKKLICGDTTSTIVSLYLGSMLREIPDSARNNLPGLSRLEGVDLVTEGMLTLSRTMEYLALCRGRRSAIPHTHDAAALIADELMLADTITFMVGLADNSSYANLKLPSSSLFRKSVIRQMCDLLTEYEKEVVVEYC